MPVLGADAVWRMSCASESELLSSLLSHMQVSVIEPEPPRSFLSCSGQGFNVRVNLATSCRPYSCTGVDDPAWDAFLARPAGLWAIGLM